MNGNEVLRIVDAIHRDKNIDKENVFEGIEQAIMSAAKKHYGEDIPARDSKSTAATATRRSLKRGRRSIPTCWEKSSGEFRPKPPSR